MAWLSEAVHPQQQQQQAACGRRAACPALIFAENSMTDPELIPLTILGWLYVSHSDKMGQTTLWLGPYCLIVAVADIGMETFHVWWQWKQKLLISPG